MAGDSNVSPQELACIYSAAILADDDIPVTADKMVTLLKAAGVTVEPVWPTLYAKALQTVDLKAYITRVGTAPAGMGAGTGGAPGGDKPEVAPEAPTTAAAAAVEEEDSDDDDMGLSLFD